MKLTPHFTLEELAGTTTQYRAKNLQEAKKIMGRMYQLAGFAERVREIVGKPLIINSGYRCVSLNNYLGGALISQHLKGEALDLVCRTLSVKSMYNRIKASDLKYDQMIIEKNKSGSEWLHISIGSRMQRLKFEDGTYTYLD